MPRELGRGDIVRDAGRLRALLAAGGSTTHTHSDYVRIATADTITAVHAFSPPTVNPPFSIGANAQNHLVDYLNADLLDGVHLSAIQSEIDTDIATHAAIPGAHHALVTLSTALGSNLLGLTGQEITLDTQAANLVFAGPASGAAAAPAFRSLVDADIPAAIARDSEVTTAISTHASNANAHHNQSHVLATTSALGPDHTVSGLTARQVLIATGATTALFRALQEADMPSSMATDAEVTAAISTHAGLPNAHHNQSHVLATTAALGPDHTVSGLTAGQVLRATGATTAVFAAIQDGDLPSTIVRTSRTLSVSGLGLSGLGDLSANRTITLTSSSNPGAAAAILASTAAGGLTLQWLTSPLVAAAASNSLTLRTITAGYAVRVEVKTTTIERYVDFKEYGTDGIQMNFVGSGIISTSSDSLYLAPAADLIIDTTGAGNDVVINTNQLTVISSTGRVGVGTAAPESVFHISAAVSGSVIEYIDNTQAASTSNYSSIVMRAMTDSALAETAYIQARFSATTHASRSGQLIFQTVQAGTVGNRLYIGAGLQVGIPTGGDKGAGTANFAGDIYKNNTAYNSPDFCLEHYFTGAIDKFSANEGAKDYSGLLPLEKLKGYLHQNLHLPGRSNEPMGIFERGNIAQQWIEEMALYITELHDRVARLEGVKP